MTHFLKQLHSNPLYSWHGTIDTTLYYANLGQTLLQWSNVNDIAFTKNVTNTPQSGYTQIVYGDGTHLVGYSALNVGHTVPVHETVDLAWFGITGGSTGTTTTSVPVGTPTTTTSVPTTSTGSGSIPKWSQW